MKQTAIMAKILYFLCIFARFLSQIRNFQQFDI